MLGVTAACGSGAGTAAPTGPAASPPPTTVVVDIVGINGAQSFSPNPATVPPGEFVVWQNADAVVHRVVFDDGEVDSGALAPGAFSSPAELAAPGAYHCSIHPDMIGRTVDGR